MTPVFVRMTKVIVDAELASVTFYKFWDACVAEGRISDDEDARLVAPMELIHLNDDLWHESTEGLVKRQVEDIEGILRGFDAEYWQFMSTYH